MDKKNENVYEAPILLDAEDLEDVAGGCLFNCSNGSCRPKEKDTVSG